MRNCYELKVCVPRSQIRVETLTPSVTVLGGRAFERGLGHEGRALMYGIIIDFKRDGREQSSRRPACADRRRMATCEPGRGLSPEPRLAGSLTSDPSLQNCER